jgi:hypothetical protein
MSENKLTTSNTNEKWPYGLLSPKNWAINLNRWPEPFIRFWRINCRFVESFFYPIPKDFLGKIIIFS